MAGGGGGGFGYSFSISMLMELMSSLYKLNRLSIDTISEIFLYISDKMYEKDIEAFANTMESTLSSAFVIAYPGYFRNAPIASKHKLVNSIISILNRLSNMLGITAEDNYESVNTTHNNNNNSSSRSNSSHNQGGVYNRVWREF